MKGRRGIVIAVIAVLAILFVTGNLPPGASGGGNGGTNGGGGGGGGGGSGEGQTFTGEGRTETDPFQLDGGDYFLTWWTEGDGPCQFDARLRSTTNQLVSQQAGRMFNVSGERAERTSRVNRVTAGEYYLQVSGSCRWSITFTPNEA